MSRRLRKWKLWGGASLNYAAAVLGISLFASVLSLLEGESAKGALSKLSFVVLMGGMLILFIVGVSLFQTYFPVLLSMGATRKAIIRTFLLNLAATILILTVLTGLLWSLIPDDALYAGMVSADIAPPRADFAPLGCAAGILFLGAALGMTFGAVMIRWRKAGVIILALIYMVASALFGIYIASGGMAYMPEGPAVLHAGRTSACLWIFAAGMAVYLASGVFALAVIRKAEARV